MAPIRQVPQIFGTQLGGLVRPPRIELGLRVPETLVISFSLRAQGFCFLSLAYSAVNEAAFLAAAVATETISS